MDKESFINHLLCCVMDVLEEFEPEGANIFTIYSIEACLRFASRVHMLFGGSLEDLKTKLLEQWEWNINYRDEEKEKVFN